MYHMVSSSYYFWLGVGNLQWRERIHARIFRACAVLVGSNVFITQEDAVASFLVVFSLVTFFGLFHFYSRAAQCFAFPAKPYNQSLILKKEKWDARSFKKERGERERKVSQMPHRIGRIEVVPIRRARLSFTTWKRANHTIYYWVHIMT